MNYLKIYNSLIYKRLITEPLVKDTKKFPGKIETQHIIPLACNGPDVCWNKVNLTVREHVLAHWLLAKIYDNTKFSSIMWHTYLSMRGKGKCYKTSRTLQTKREQVAAAYFNNLGKIFVNNGKKQILCYKDNIPEGYKIGMLFKEKIRYVHDPIACKSKRIPVSAPLPVGFHEGIYFSPSAREHMSNGGKKNRKSLSTS